VALLASHKAEVVALEEAAAGIDRRTFIGATSLSVAGAVVAGAGISAASAEAQGWLPAEVVGRVSPDVVDVLPFGGTKPVRVTVPPRATLVHRGRPGAGLSEFATGEGVAIEIAGLPPAELTKVDGLETAGTLRANRVVTCVRGSGPPRR
jgi:hypothetical protein